MGRMQKKRENLSTLQAPGDFLWGGGGVVMAMLLGWIPLFCEGSLEGGFKGNQSVRLCCFS